MNKQTPDQNFTQVGTAWHCRMLCECSRCLWSCTGCQSWIHQWAPNHHTSISMFNSWCCIILSQSFSFIKILHLPVVSVSWPRQAILAFLTATDNANSQHRSPQFTVNTETGFQRQQWSWAWRSCPVIPLCSI